MKFLSSNMKVWFAGILIVFAVFIYRSFFAGSEAEVLQGPPAEKVGADLIKIADEISRATLSRELFSNTGFRVLSDFSTPLEPEPQGRVNPFAPFGQE